MKKHISYISQERALDPEMTGNELLSYFSALYGLSGEPAKQRYKALVDSFAMADFIGRRVNGYSGGQAQRLHLAIGMIHQPALLLLDEPTAALDPAGKAFFWDFMQSYQAQGNTLIIVSHELDKVHKYCSRVLFMDKGRLIADDSPDEIVQTYAQPVLHIRLVSAVKNGENLKTFLLEAAAFANIQLKNQSIRMEIDACTHLEQAKILMAVLQVFQDQQLPVSECRWEGAGLENAYFKLTGEKITRASGGGKSKGKRRSR